MFNQRHDRPRRPLSLEMLYPQEKEVAVQRVITSLMIIMIFPTISVASNWKLIKPTGAENNGFYIDMDNIKRISKNKVRFWYTVAKGPEDAKKDSGYRYYLEMDCLKKRYRSINSEEEDNSQSYSRSGVSVEVSTGATIIWDNISPDSFEESFHDALCRKRK